MIQYTCKRRCIYVYVWRAHWVNFCNRPSCAHLRASMNYQATGHIIEPFRGEGPHLASGLHPATPGKNGKMRTRQKICVGLCTIYVRNFTGSPKEKLGRTCRQVWNKTKNHQINQERTTKMMFVFDDAMTASKIRYRSSNFWFHLNLQHISCMWLEFHRIWVLFVMCQRSAKTLTVAKCGSPTRDYLLSQCMPRAQRSPGRVDPGI